MKHATVATLMLAALAGIGAVAPAPAAPASKSPPADTKPAEEARADEKPSGQQPACRVCGSTCQLEPVCVCEPATTKKTKTIYTMKCEPVCVPEPCVSLHGQGKRHAGSCTSAVCDGSCGAASVRTKKTLMKTIKEEEVDVIERKVEYLCDHCAGIDAAPTCCSCSGHGPAPVARPWWKSLWPW